MTTKTVEILDLPKGLYKLEEHLPNPSHDKRGTHGWMNKGSLWKGLYVVDNDYERRRLIIEEWKEQDEEEGKPWSEELYAERLQKCRDKARLFIRRGATQGHFKKPTEEDRERVSAAKFKKWVTTWNLLVENLVRKKANTVERWRVLKGIERAHCQSILQELVDNWRVDLHDVVEAYGRTQTRGEKQ